MPDVVVAHLNATTCRRIIDGTLGGGGHARCLLEASASSELLGIDQDEAAIEAAGRNLAAFGDRVHIRRGPFSQMAEFAEELGWDSVDGILLDVGVSSHQIDTPTRGFSHRADGPLDMRMDRRSPVTAATILNHESEANLTRIFRDYGEERQARRIARAVVRRRQEKPWERTGELAELLEKVLGPSRPGSLPVSTLPFQALRIAVNEELEELEDALIAAADLLAVGGRLVVIAFHSLEDRMVKQFFRRAEATCVCPPDFPVCRCGKTATLRVVTRKPDRASETERAVNRRAASARLRAAEKL